MFNELLSIYMPLTAHPSIPHFQISHKYIHSPRTSNILRTENWNQTSKACNLCCSQECWDIFQICLYIFWNGMGMKMIRTRRMKYPDIYLDSANLGLGYVLFMIILVLSGEIEMCAFIILLSLFSITLYSTVQTIFLVSVMTVKQTWAYMHKVTTHIFPCWKCLQAAQSRDSLLKTMETIQMIVTYYNYTHAHKILNMTSYSLIY